MTAAAKEHIVPVTWGPAGYRAALDIAEGKFKEACAELSAGERIRWSFRGDADTSFNIHFHEGEKVTYPAKKDAVRVDDGLLEVTTTQTYCWMWRASRHPAKVEVSLEKVAR